MLKPRPHQLDAIQANIEAFKTQDRVKNIMACGTGKTLVAIKTIDALIAQYGYSKVVIFVPTILLIQQTASSIISEYGREFFSYSIVCSRKNAGELDDIDISEVSESLNLDVINKPIELKNFLNKDTSATKVIFCTYASSRLLQGLTFDIGVFDEAHKTAGPINKPFSFALHDENVLIKKRLFLTATERVVYKGRKNTSRIGMNNIDLYGESSYTLSFKQAASLGLIVDVKLLITVVNKSDVAHLIRDENHNLYTLANLYALEKAYKEYGIKKVITFHHTIQNADSFATASTDLGHNTLRSFHVNGGQSADIRRNNLLNFQSSERAFISNARCLTEGIDTPDIDAVAFFDPKSSTIDIVQAIGRAMRLSHNKQQGYIILPLYLWDYEEALNSENIGAETSFSNIVDVINVLKNENDGLRTSLTKSNFGEVDKLLKGDLIEVSGQLPEHISKEYLFDNIALEMVSEYDIHFMSMLGELDNHIKRTGIGYVYRDDPNTKLAMWANAMRHNHRQKALPQFRLDLLIEHGFIFSIFEAEWEASFLKYKGYRESGFGDHGIPDKTIKKWIKRQKDFFREGRLQANRLARLKSLGFDYISKDDIWAEGYNKMLAELEGKTSLSDFTKKDQSFEWLRTQRRRWGVLSGDKRALLEALGWESYIKHLGRHTKKPEQA